MKGERPTATGEIGYQVLFFVVNAMERGFWLHISVVGVSGVGEGAKSAGGRRQVVLEGGDEGGSVLGGYLFCTIWAFSGAGRRLVMYAKLGLQLGVYKIEPIAFLGQILKRHRTLPFFLFLSLSISLHKAQAKILGSFLRVFEKISLR